ncbi:MAG: ATP-binding cassette domain-containing protein [Acidimicrobiia bacterium]
MTAAIRAEGLTRRFAGGTAVDGLSLEVAQGEVLALLGPNGAGKTTTVRMLNGVLRPHAGSASVLGLDPMARGDDVRRLTGVLTEHAGLDERLTARENLEVTGRIRGLDATEVGRRAGELLERFGMSDRADRQVQGFSTGERKRVALARALLHRPEVLFLDEPTSGLDPTSTRDVVELIAGLASEEGATIVLCTHFLGEAGRLAHRMAVLDHGRLQAFGRPDELAARLWHGLDVDVDLGGPIDEALAAEVAAAPGVLAVVPVPGGARVRVEDRGTVPTLVRLLVERGGPVFGATARPPTLEDVYFAVQARAAAARDGDPAAARPASDRPTGAGTP